MSVNCPPETTMLLVIVRFVAAGNVRLTPPDPAGFDTVSELIVPPGAAPTLVAVSATFARLKITSVVPFGTWPVLKLAPTFQEVLPSGSPCVHCAAFSRVRLSSGSMRHK